MVIFVSAWLTQKSTVVFRVGWRLASSGWPQMKRLATAPSGLSSRLAWASSHGGWEGFWSREELSMVSWGLCLKLADAYFHHIALAKTSYKKSSDSGVKEIDFNYLWRKLQSHIAKTINTGKHEQSWSFFVIQCMERRDIFLKVESISLSPQHLKSHPLSRLLGEAAQCEGECVDFGVRQTWVTGCVTKGKYTSSLNFITCEIWTINIRLKWSLWEFINTTCLTHSNHWIIVTWPFFLSKSGVRLCCENCTDSLSPSRWLSLECLPVTVLESQKGPRTFLPQTVI